MEDFINFDVRDCAIDSWEIYPDEIKKRWCIQLIEDKRTLQLQVMNACRDVKVTINIIQWHALNHFVY
jgi:hypothetical protein